MFYCRAMPRSEPILEMSVAVGSSIHCRSMASPVIVDARNLLDPHSLRQMGFTYEGVGR